MRSARGDSRSYRLRRERDGSQTLTWHRIAEDNWIEDGDWVTVAPVEGVLGCERYECFDGRGEVVYRSTASGRCFTCKSDAAVDALLCALAQYERVDALACAKHRRAVPEPEWCNRARVWMRRGGRASSSARSSRHEEEGGGCRA